MKLLALTDFIKPFALINLHSESIEFWTYIKLSVEKIVVLKYVYF